jgi:hypothetical protein
MLRYTSDVSGMLATHSSSAAADNVECRYRDTRAIAGKCHLDSARKHITNKTTNECESNPGEMSSRHENNHTIISEESFHIYKGNNNNPH